MCVFMIVHPAWLQISYLYSSFLCDYAQLGNACPFPDCTFLATALYGMESQGEWRGGAAGGTGKGNGNEDGDGEGMKLYCSGSSVCV